MKNWKAITIGFVAGAVAMTATPAMAAAYKSVSALLMHDATFKIGDQLSVTESNQPVLNYNGYTYVPTRFVAERLGCEVGWDPTTRQVTIKKPEQEEKIVYVEKPVEKIVYVEKDESTGAAATYKKMPVTITKSSYDVKLRSVSLPEEDSTSPAKTTLYLNVKNIKADRVELAQDTAVLTLDGKEYSMALRDSQWDKKWNDKVKKDEEVDGFLVFDGTNRDYSTGTLKVDVRVLNDNEYKTETITINFKR